MQRIWREEGLRVPAKARKRRRLGDSTVPAERLKAERPNHVTSASQSTPRNLMGLPEKAAAELVKTLDRVGVTTLGRFAELGADHVADRLGPIGLQALEMANGLDRKLEPRPPIRRSLSGGALRRSSVGRLAAPGPLALIPATAPA